MLKVQLIRVWIVAVLASGHFAFAAETSSRPLLKPPPCMSVSAVRQEMSHPGERLAVMEDRYEALRQIDMGWQKSGVPLVGFDGRGFGPAGCGDDMGIYFLIPGLARIAQIPLARAIDLFLFGITLGSAALGSLGLMIVCRTRFGRIVAIIAVALVCLLTLRTGDVYIIQSSAVIAFAPWIVLFGSRPASPLRTLFFTFSVSFALAIVNLVRSHAATSVFLFMGWIFLVKLQGTNRFKLLLIIVAIAGLALPIGYSNILLRARDEYLHKQGYAFIPGLRHHVFWHAVYLGFGFINNDVVPGYLDEIAAAKVREKAPQAIYTSPEYEKALKYEVIQIIARHPALVIETVAAKLGVIAGWLFICANVGLVAAYFYPKHWAIEAGFWSAISLQALAGILVMPTRAYLLGFIAFAVLYGVISIDVGLQQGSVRICSRWIRLSWAARGIRQIQEWQQHKVATLNK
jgi:hypothetical protein